MRSACGSKWKHLPNENTPPCGVWTVESMRVRASKHEHRHKEPRQEILTQMPHIRYITCIRRSIRTERKGGKLGLNKQRFHSHRNTKTLECEPAGGRAQPTISSNIHIDAVCATLNLPTTEGVTLATQNRYQRHKPVQRDPVAPQQRQG